MTRGSTDPAALAGLAAHWRERWVGSPLQFTAAGPGWLRLGLAGDERISLLLTALPGAGLALAHAGRLPEPLHRALAPDRSLPPARLLAGRTLAGIGALAGERVLALRLESDDGAPLFLLHQLFGSPGNTALVDGAGVLHWSWRRPPHALLTAPPPPGTWRHGEPDPAALAGTPAGLADALTAQWATSLRASLKRRRHAADRLCRNLTADLASADRGDEYRRKAEALAVHLHTLAPGADSCEVADPRDGTPLRIELDPAIPPAENLAAWFRRARKAEKGRDVIAERLAEARAAAAALDLAAAGIDGLTAPVDDAGEGAFERLAAVQAWQDAHPELAPATGARRARREVQEPARPFRRYRIDERWDVWVGRDNRENDELTHRASHGRDLWLHAQGVPGSHVILRTAGHPERVPRSVLEKAAALAALHSKARHSGVVPVIYTERRYVRRPRKSPPGTATCLRDQSLFVEPGVAVGVETA